MLVILLTLCKVHFFFSHSNCLFYLGFFYPLQFMGNSTCIQAVLLCFTGCKNTFPLKRTAFVYCKQINKQTTKVGCYIPLATAVTSWFEMI